MEKELKTQTWISDFQSEGPLVIAGPCSAETPEQLMSIAENLPREIKIFRAGIWKPRTRPGGFEGVGAIGLNWLQEVKRQTGLKMAIEVANAQHVALALEHDMDVLWIGARTAVNPFAVQEIADALRGTDKIVLLKNPVNPDLSLWIGGLERLMNANITRLGAIHRGFSTYEKTKYRNVPEWQLAIDLKTQLPEMPLICDPSHITGNRDRILEVSQQALDLNYDGLIIETHNQPDLAWSDAAQQVSPQQLQAILAQLKVRHKTDQTEDFIAKINSFRLQIDEMDTKILSLLSKRMQVADEIGVLKKERNVAVFQQERWLAVLDKMLSEGSEKGLTKDFVTAFYAAIHQESIFRQDRIINKK